MALDEAVLESAEPGGCYLRRYCWAGRSPHGATFGYFQPWACAESAARRRFPGADVPVVRRPTGGGVVFHDGDVTFSFVFPWPAPLTPGLVYRNIHLGVHAGLKMLGLASRLWAEPRPDKTLRVECFSAPEPMDLTHEDGAKFLGGALRRRRGVGLYQGSLRPEGFGAQPEMLWRAVEEGLALQWRTKFSPAKPRPCVAAEARRLDVERYRTKEWNRKR